jgi:hypothetical protein
VLGNSGGEKEKEMDLPYRGSVSVGLWLGDWAGGRERRREGVQVREAGFWGFNSRKSMFDFLGVSLLCLEGKGREV